MEVGDILGVRGILHAGVGVDNLKFFFLGLCVKVMHAVYLSCLN